MEKTSPRRSNAVEVVLVHYVCRSNRTRSVEAEAITDLLAEDTGNRARILIASSSGIQIGRKEFTGEAEAARILERGLEFHNSRYGTQLYNSANLKSIDDALKEFQLNQTLQIWAYGLAERTANFFTDYERTMLEFYFADSHRAVRLKSHPDSTIADPWQDFVLCMSQNHLETVKQIYRDIQVVEHPMVIDTIHDFVGRQPVQPVWGTADPDAYEPVFRETEHQTMLAVEKIVDKCY